MAVNDKSNSYYHRYLPMVWWLELFSKKIYFITET